ncbi:hypothetical protein V2J09_000724 [Rumex salicifolius]
MNHHQHYQLPPPFLNNHLFIPNPSFNPNQNPNFNPTFIPAPPPPLQRNSSQPKPESSTDAPLPDLSTSLSLLTDLIDLSSSTLDSLSSLLSHHPLPLSSEELSRCLFNPNHLMPPESLFLHSLHCPSPIAEDVRSLIDDLQYPKTLKTEPQLIEQHKSVNPLHDPHTELCFSFEDYVVFGSNFFYQDCPGVVSSLGEDAAKMIFSLPSVLSVECVNFASGTDWEANDSFRLLPSELWVVKCEIGQWTNFPNAYSYTVLRALLCIEMANERDIQMWVIANSPRFGVVIDSPMRDHLFALFRFCVKAIVREARRSYEPFLKENLDNTGHLNPETLSFSCPSLVEVLSWLATQLSVLYGEANAKLFTIGVLKQLLQNAASISLVYPLGAIVDHEQSSSLAGNLEADQLIGKVSEKKVDCVMSGGIVSRPFFIYQVAIAIAALHERSLFEDKIKALRNHQYMTAYQRVSEHDYLSKKAQDERQKRSNYRPLIDHDGLPVQCQHDKDMMNKNKTKEQLLAEERDYKRRRMSYRGKKTKRNVKEVMRDIIEEHMEAIREAGGIGIFDMGVEDGSVSTYKPLGQYYGKNTEFNKSSSYEYESSRDHHDVFNRHLNSDYISQTMDPAEHTREQKASSSRHRDDSYHRNPGRERNQGASTDQRNGRRENDRRDSNPRSPSNEKRYGERRKSRSERIETQEGYSYPRSPSREESYRSSRDKSYPRNFSIDRNYENARYHTSDREIKRKDGDSYLESPSTERYKRTSDERSSWRNETEEEIYKSRSTSLSLSSHGNRSSRTSPDVHSGRKDKRRSEDKDKERRKRVRHDRSDSMSEFDDRYAPSRSPNT